jgi:hypothetical protein
VSWTQCKVQRRFSGNSDATKRYKLWAFSSFSTDV